MAITATSWSHYVTIPESYTPAGTLSGYVGVITESVITKLSSADQDTYWNNVENGGGDVRICLNTDGTSQLPVEVVSLDSVARTCVIWYRKTSYDGLGEIQLFVGKSGETQPLVTDTYGRNAVWSDYDYVLHLNDSSATDSTGNFTPTLSGSVSVASGAYFGDGLDFTGGGRIDIPSVSRSVDYQLQALTRLTSDPSANHWIVGTGGTSNSDYGLWADNSDFSSGRSDVFSGTFRTGSGSQRLLSAENSAKGGNSYSVAIKNDSTTEGAMLLDGVEVDVVSNAGISSSTNTVYVGNSTGFGTSFNGVLQEIRARNTPLSDDHLVTEHSNYSDAALFYGTPTIQTTGAGESTISGSFNIQTQVYGDFTGYKNALGMQDIQATTDNGFTGYKNALGMQDIQATTDNGFTGYKNALGMQDIQATTDNGFTGYKNALGMQDIQAAVTVNWVSSAVDIRTGSFNIQTQVYGDFTGYKNALGMQDIQATTDNGFTGYKNALGMQDIQATTDNGFTGYKKSYGLFNITSVISVQFQGYNGSKPSVVTIIQMQGEDDGTRITGSDEPTVLQAGESGPKRLTGVA